VGRGCDQILQIVPRSVLERLDPHKPLVLLITFEKVLRIGQERSMNKGEAHMVLVNAYLADPGADWPSAFFIIVTETIPEDSLGCSRSDRCDYVSKLQDDFLQMGLCLLEKYLEITGGEHLLGTFARVMPNQKETVGKNLEEYSNQFYVALSCLRPFPHNH
jgi:hypothetical protein